MLYDFILVGEWMDFACHEEHDESRIVLFLIDSRISYACTIECGCKCDENRKLYLDTKEPNRCAQQWMEQTGSGGNGNS